MAGKKPSTPKEIPLHDVVLKIMFEANKEKPAKLTASDVFWKISDANVSEITISDVLKWLVAQKRVENLSSEYWLDRFEFLEQRSADEGENSSHKNNKKSNGEDLPLHEVVLEIMFKASKERPAEFTLDDIFWKISDPSVRESQLGDVLKWLAHHHRVEHRLGKYSLDRIEFLDQKKAEEAKAPVKEKIAKAKKEPKPPVKKVVKKVAPKKIIIPTAPEETVLESKPKPSKKPVVKSPPKKVLTEKVNEVKKTPKKPELVKDIQVKPAVKAEGIIKSKVETDQIKVNTLLLLLIAICFLYTIYVLTTMGEASSVDSLKIIIVKLFAANSVTVIVFVFLLYRKK